jgi:hypothetical protein
MGGYVSESTPIDPDVTQIPAGLWDFNVWALGTANANASTVIRAKVYTYNGTDAPTLLGTSGEQVINNVSAQFSLSVLIPQTTLALTDRIYVEIEVKAAANGHTATLQFGDGQPSHVHTSLPLVGGTGLWKSLAGVLQSPASLLTNDDVATDAAIAQSKINGLTTALDGKQPLLTTSAPLDLTKGGIAAIYSGDTRMTGTLMPATIRHNSNLVPDVLGTATLSYTNGSTTVSYSNLSAGVTLAPGMSVSTGVLQGSVIRSVDTGASTFVATIAPTATGSASANIYNTSLATFVSGTAPNLDGRTMQVGDIVLLTGQLAAALNGAWRIDVIAGSKYTMSRPTWFRGTFTGAILFDVQFGTANSALIVSVMPTTISTTALATIGLDSLSAFSIAKRADCATLGSNTFTGQQTFSAASAAGNAPMLLNAGTLNTTPVANRVEWDGNFLYNVNASSVRTQQAAFVAAPSTATSAGIAGQVAFDATGLYVCTATNTWRKATLATF